VKSKLRAAAVLLVVVGGGFWFFGGMHLGWTKTSVQTMQKDPVTEIDYPVIEKRFVAGVDFLGGFLALAGALWGASLFARSGKPEPKA
jgi:hypothetical protein